jgi:uncharacterized protein YlzI (FlbEa/FlbD family)
MGRPRILYLTVVNFVPNEQGQARIDKEIAKEDAQDEVHGFSKAWYEDQGLRPPKNLASEKSEIDENGLMTLKKEEIEEEFLDLIVNYSEFESCEDNSEGFSFLELKSGKGYTVVESAEEIYAQIFLMDQSILDRIISRIKQAISTLKRE